MSYGHAAKTDLRVALYLWNDCDISRPRTDHNNQLHIGKMFWFNQLGLTHRTNLLLYINENTFFQTIINHSVIKPIAQKMSEN